MKVEVYRNLTRQCWSVRSGGRVIGHRHEVMLRTCTMRVREGGRQRALREGQRNVHAWIEGDLCEDVADTVRTEIGYNPFRDSTFTLRPGFDPVFTARFVILSRSGRAYAVL
ncbi:hypothetical protein [Microvirga makkahensis]|uniref:Uncharacterized protein n=1 Tax=Microvirga makkahensis TaxID=1128670 RepID=A0A7X3SMX0_9HYPH|nr:hypothetical protein [Microvirga makkahensis]MXQ10444.1 hypothetical protein [Microvirga makkahensis]